MNAKQFSDIGADVMTGYRKAFRVFPIVGDVTEFDTIEDCWDYAVTAWIKFTA